MLLPNHGRRARSVVASRLRVRLAVLQLEDRVVPALVANLPDGTELHAVIMAGKKPDSAAARVDANLVSSAFAGVGSIRIVASDGSIYIGSGTPIDATHVLTAGHVVDISGDGVPDILGATFNLNYGGTLTSKISVASWTINPNFTGFANPSVNDDIAILTLSQPLPAGVPIYPLYSDSLAGKVITLVGYGRSGSGTSGYTVDPSFSVKRSGQNVVDAFYGQDDAGQAASQEVFRFDFDGDKGKGTFGGATLGNTLETTIGGGDSGGPSFVKENGIYYLAGVNTYTESYPWNEGKFGSLAGGMSVPAYRTWINSVLAAASTTPLTQAAATVTTDPSSDAPTTEESPGDKKRSVGEVKEGQFVVALPDLASAAASNAAQVVGTVLFLPSNTVAAALIVPFATASPARYTIQGLVLVSVGAEAALGVGPAPKEVEQPEQAMPPVSLSPRPDAASETPSQLFDAIDWISLTSPLGTRTIDTASIEVATEGTAASAPTALVNPAALALLFTGAMISTRSFEVEEQREIRPTRRQLLV